jgi:hypothetical protein
MKELGRVRIEDNVLECPLCPGTYGYLHHGAVTIYHRHEDEPLVTKIEVSKGEALTSKVDNSYSGNPSLRRHGLAICFECEHCGQTSELTIAQHKGGSLIAWRGTERTF